LSNLFGIGLLFITVAVVWQVRYEQGTKIAAMKNAARVHLKINGRVQGVYFRASTVEQARRLGVTGWVMNCRDSSVAVIAEGERERLEELIGWCRSGPPGAQVKEIRVEWEDSKDEFQGFFIKH
jgi:acylphosphatase